MSGIDSTAFARDGFVVCRGLVDEARLAAAVDETRAIAGSRLAAGVHSFTPPRDGAPATFAALLDSDLWPALHDLVAPGELQPVTDAVQVLVNCPPTMAEPATPHIDHHVPDSPRPDSFTVLVAILLSDQERDDAGNVWVWPGTHVLHSEYLQAYGPTALLAHGGSIRRAAPAVHLPRPVPVTGRAGDVLVAHPLLGHATGPNTSAAARWAAYFRLRRTDHLTRWEACLTDPLLEYAAPR